MVHTLTGVTETLRGRQGRRVPGMRLGWGDRVGTVCADSFRHVIYNTLWMSNRLIKYILYKYTPHCTRRPLAQPLCLPPTHAKVPGGARRWHPHSRLHWSLVARSYIASIKLRVGGVRPIASTGVSPSPLRGKRSKWTDGREWRRLHLLM